MRILLILPKDNQYFYKGAFRKTISWAPQTLTTLAALVPRELNADIDIIDEGVQRAAYNKKKYDIVGISCGTSSCLRAYELCQYFKRMKSYVVLGGHHPSQMPEEALLYADSVVVGMAEVSWPQLLNDYINGSPKQIYQEHSITTFNPPHPRRDLVKKNLYNKIPTVLATQGCGNKCEFCTMNRVWNRHYKRPIREIINEIKTLQSKYIFFLDPNITFDKQYAKELFESLIPLNVKWASAGTIDVYKDDELLELMAKSNCLGLLIGFESFSAESLKNCNKASNDINVYKQAVEKLHACNIKALGTFVLGFDGDTKESILETVENVEKIKVDIPRYSVLTPYPGTPLFAKLKNEDRILTEDWSLYDQEHVVYHPQNISPQDLEKLLHYTWKETYSFKRLLKRSYNSPNHKLLIMLNNLSFRHYAFKLKNKNLRTSTYINFNKNPKRIEWNIQS